MAGDLAIKTKVRPTCESVLSRFHIPSRHELRENPVGCFSIDDERSADGAHRYFSRGRSCQCGRQLPSLDITYAGKRERALNLVLHIVLKMRWPDLLPSERSGHRARLTTRHHAMRGKPTEGAAAAKTGQSRSACALRLAIRLASRTG